MNFSKQYINDISTQTSFLGNNIEKVIRLMNILDFIFNESSFKDVLSLKGATAINLIHINLKRLSVDIDLDYHGFLEKDKVIQDGELILQELDEFMEKEGYLISDKSRGSLILSSRMYSYENSSGNKDNIKVEINFIDRVSLYPCKITKISYFNKSINVVSPSIEELYGMKLAALIDRSKPRDLYDSDFFFNNIAEINVESLKKATIFYLSLDWIYEIDAKVFSRIKSINWSMIKKELIPVLKKGEKFNLEEVQKNVISYLSQLLILNENEKIYLIKFSNGNYDPSLLFDETISEKVKNHPMAKWRALKNTK